MADNVEIQGLEFEITANTEKAEKNLDKLTSTLERLKKALSGVDATPVTSAVENISKAVNKVDDSKLAKLKSTLSKVGSAAQSVKAKVRDIGTVPVSSGIGAEAVSDLTEVSGRVGILTREFDRLKSSLSGLKGIAGTVGEKLGGIGRGLVGKITNLGKQFQRAIFYSLLYNAAYKLISSITKAFQEGFQNMYQYSESFAGKFAQSMDSLATSALYLKNSLASAFAPLVNQLAPVIDILVVKVATLLDYVAQLMAALSGQSTYTKAIKAATEFGEGTDNAAKSLKSFTAGFDELNIIPSNSGSGNGANTPDFTSMFEEAQVSSKIAAVAQKLKELLPLAVAVGAVFAGWSIAKGILPAITAISGKLAALIPMAGTIGTRMLATGIGMVIAGLPTYLISVYDAIENGLTWLNGLLIPLGSAMAGAGVGAIIGSLGGPIGTGIGALVGLVIGVLTDLSVWIVQNFGDVIAGFFSNVWEWFDGKIIQPVTNALGTAANWVWEKVISPIIEFFSPIADAVADVAAHIWNNAVEIVSGIVEGVKTIWNKVKEISLKVVEVLAAVGTAFYTYVIVPVTGWVKEHMIEPLKKAATWVYDKVINPAVEFAVAKLSYMRDTAVKIFKGIWTTVSDFASGIFKGVINGIFFTIERTINGFIRMLNLAIGLIDKIPGVNITKVEPIYIPRFADGGFPDEGQLFIARESGAEMVGSICGKTAVANNDQIVESVSSGVYRAIKEAIGNNGSSNGNVTIVVQMDGKEMFRQMVKQNNDVVRQTGASPLRV